MSQLLVERAAPLVDPPALPAAKGHSHVRLVLAAIVVLGAGVRAIGFTSLGLWRDDAWAALSSRVGFGTALHMGVTAPGFYLAERNWIILHPGPAWWAQVLPYTLGVLCIPAIYVVARRFGQSHRIALVAAFITSLSPVCVTYSTRIKEYQADFLLCCLLLVAAEAVRRDPSRKRCAVLAVSSILGLFVSASLAPVVLGVWLGVATLRSRRLMPGAAATGGGCLLVAGAFYRHLSPVIGTPWRGYYLRFTSLGDFVASLHQSLLHFDVLMVGGFDKSPAELVVFFIALSALFVVGIFGGRKYRGAGLVLGVALCANVLGIVPLGTGRTDEVLYPAALLLLGSALGRLQPVCAGLLHTPRAARMGSLAVAGLLCVPLISNVPLFRSYPGVDVQGLAAKVAAQFEPGDHLVVNELMRYSWALYEDQALDLRFGTQWSTGFTVVSTQPDTFIVPSEYYEGDSHPAAWAHSLSRYRRLWFIETKPLSLSLLYATLSHDGWHEVRAVSAPGCAALLLER